MERETGREQKVFRGDSWIVDGEWIAPGRDEGEAIDYLRRCGVTFDKEIILVWRFEG